VTLENDLLPYKKDLLETPVVVDHTDGNIEIVREFSGKSLTVGLFDFDGTISDERVGWPNLAVPNNVAYLIGMSSPHMHHKQAEEIVVTEIEQTIGIPTYLQMKRLCSILEDHGYCGPKLDPMMLKNSYNDALVGMVESRRAKLRTGEMTMDEMRIDGAMQLMTELQKRLSNGIYLASGSDLDVVSESVEYLGYSHFFPQDRIMAAGSLGPEDDAKEVVISRMTGEMGLRGEELVTFGDGFPEMLYTYRAGGVGVGVLSRDESHYEHLGHFTIEQKKQRLLNAGAHILVANPFQNIPELLDTIAKGYQA